MTVRTFSTAQLDAARREGDALADATIAQMYATGDRAQAGAWLHRLGQPGAEADPTLPDFLRQYAEALTTLPAWADPGRMRRAALFYQRHAPEIMTMLGFLSLPYCYAAADGAQVLRASRRIVEDTRKRLVETGQFVLNVLQPHAFAPGGAGFASVRQVRLIHAAVRYHLQQKPDWDMAWGLPVNQEDMAGTNLAFSYVPLRGLRRIHVVVSPGDAHDFMHLWNVIGHLLGIRAELLPDNLREALLLANTIEQRHFRASEAGRELTAALLTSLEQSVEVPTIRRIIPAYLRFLLGDAMADMLGVPAQTDGLVLPSLRVFNAVKSLTGQFAQPQTRPLRQMAYTLRTEAGEYPFRLPMVG